MNDHIYISPMKPEVQAQGVFSCSPWCFDHMVLIVSKGCEQLFHIEWNDNLTCLSPSNHLVIIATSRSVSYITYITQIVTCELGIYDANVCV